MLFLEFHRWDWMRPIAEGGKVQPDNFSLIKNELILLKMQITGDFFLSLNFLLNSFSWICIPTPKRNFNSLSLLSAKKVWHLTDAKYLEDWVRHDYRQPVLHFSSSHGALGLCTCYYSYSAQPKKATCNNETDLEAFSDLTNIWQHLFIFYVPCLSEIGL